MTTKPKEHKAGCFCWCTKSTLKKKIMVYDTILGGELRNGSDVCFLCMIDETREGKPLHHIRPIGNFGEHLVKYHYTRGKLDPRYYNDESSSAANMWMRVNQKDDLTS